MDALYFSSMHHPIFDVKNKVVGLECLFDPWKYPGELDFLGKIYAHGMGDYSNEDVGRWMDNSLSNLSGFFEIWKCVIREFRGEKECLGSMAMINVNWFASNHIYGSIRQINVFIWSVLSFHSLELHSTPLLYLIWIKIFRVIDTA